MRVLITGASGFLGRDVVERLILDDERVELVALLRARDEHELEKRLGKLRAHLPEAKRARVSAVRGDVAEARLGLDERGFASLAERVDRVLHVAANTSFDLPLDEARRINVGGTAHALALARAIRKRGGAGRLDYVGTAYVAGDRTDVAREDELDVGQGFRNTYERSKFEAEQLARAARDELPVAIHRPSIIVGDSRTGRTSSYKTIYWPMKVLVRFYGLWRPVLTRVVRLPVRPDCRLDVVPVDWVAASVARLFASDAAAGGCFHLAAGPDAATIEQLVNLCCDHFGVPRLRYLDPEGAIRHLGRAARPLLERAAPRLARNGELMLAYTRRNPRFDVANARAAGLASPAVDGYFQRLVAFAFEKDFGRAN